MQLLLIYDLANVLFLYALLYFIFYNISSEQKGAMSALRYHIQVDFDIIDNFYAKRTITNNIFDISKNAFICFLALSIYLKGCAKMVCDLISAFRLYGVPNKRWRIRSTSVAILARHPERRPRAKVFAVIGFLN